MKVRIIVQVAIITICCLSMAQAQSTDSVALDTTTKPFRRFDLLPAISYSPETQLTLGVIGYYYLDLSEGDPNTNISNFNLLGVYTTANQIAIEARGELFTKGNLWRIRGEVYFNRWPDRNYGLGNDANAKVVVREDQETDTLNYWPYNSDRWLFNPVVIRRVAPNWYLGGLVDLEYMTRVRNLDDEVHFLNAAAEQINEVGIEGTRIGLGWQLLFDSRDNILNPLRGAFAELTSIYYDKAWKSDFTFNSYNLDTRYYLNTFKNHTLALRSVLSARFSEEPIQIRALSRVGGRYFLRGYFRGTYQDKHMAAFEAEYRLPFWNEDLDAPFGQFWKRLGMTVFAGGAQVNDDFSNFRLNRFNAAVGTGLRILFNKESRLNIRIDVAFALREDSNGQGTKQSAFYFYLSEAF